MNRVLFRKTLRDLFANKGQTIALVAIVTLGILCFIALIGAYNNLGDSYQEMYDKTRFADVTFEVESAPLSAVDDVRAVSGVDKVTGRLIIDTGYLLPSDEPISSRLIGLPDDKRPEVNDLWIEEGRYFTAGDQAVAIVDSHFAKFYNLRVGDKVTPIIEGAKTELEIIAIATSPEYLIVTPGDEQSLLSTAESFAVLFVPLPYLQTVYSRPDSVNDFAVLLDETKPETTTTTYDSAEQPEDETDPVITDIEEVLEPHQLKSTTLQKDQASNEALQLDLESYQALAWSVPIIMLLIAAISIFMTLGRTVTAQQPQVGLMKAIGYGNGAIFTHYLLVALFVGLIGALLGVVLGLATSRFITSAYALELGLPTISVSFYPELVAAGVVLSLVATILGGVFPARSAIKRLPAEAMKYDPAAVSIAGRKSIFERIFKTGIWGRLTIRNVFRVPRRTISNVLGIVFAFVLVLMSWSWVDSLENMLDKGFNEIAQWDIQVAFNEPQGALARSYVAGWDDVIEAEPVTLVPAVVKPVQRNVDAEEKEVDISLTIFRPEQNMLNLDLIEKRYANWTVEDCLAKDRLILTPIAAEKLLLSVGDQVTVTNVYGALRLELSAIADQLNDAQGYIGTETISNTQAMETLLLAAGEQLTVTNVYGEIRQDLSAMADQLSVTADRLGATVDMVQGRLEYIRSNTQAAEPLLPSVSDQVTVTNLFGELRQDLSTAADQLSATADKLKEAQGDIRTETVPTTEYPALFNMLYLTTDPDQVDEIKQDLYKLPNAASVQSLEEARATYNLLLGLFYAFVGIMLLFSLAMAFALLYNSITITITERQREFATMRSIGTSEGRIARQLIVENVIVWLIAILPGWVLGTWVAVAIGSTLSTEWMNFRVILDPWTYVWTSVIILVTMILAGIPAFRRLRQVDLASGTKGAV